MSKYNASSDGRGNVKVFLADSGVLSYTISKGSKTKINNVQVSGNNLTITSTNEYGVIKTDVYKDIRKGILSYSNIIGREERTDKNAPLIPSKSRSDIVDQNPSKYHSVDSDSDALGCVLISIALFVLVYLVIIALSCFPKAILLVPFSSLIYIFVKAELPWKIVAALNMLVVYSYV
jgi:hypothetical protein